MTISEFAHVFGAHDDDDQKDFRVRSHSCKICPDDGGSCDKTTIGLTSLEKGKQPYYSAEGNAIRYKLCDKWKLYTDLKRLMGNGIPPHCSKHRVGLTNYLPQTPEQTAALEWAKGYVKSFQFGVDGPVGRNMVIEGPVGTGKTHLAASILADVYYRSPNRRLSVKLVTAGEIARMFKTEQGRDELSYKIMNTHMVVLDGLGSYTYNEETRSALEEAVAERRSKNLPFLLTAREPLYTYDAQLGSDVIEVLTSDMDTVVLDGGNWRETHRNIIIGPEPKPEPPPES